MFKSTRLLLAKLKKPVKKSILCGDGAGYQPPRKEFIKMIKFRKIPRFASIKEEAKFWDSHDISDYLPEMKEVKVKFLLTKPKKGIITLRVQSDLKRRLERVAESYGINLSTLARIWFIDKLKETKPQSLAT